jgi:hypothetical protein
VSHENAEGARRPTARPFAYPAASFSPPTGRRERKSFRATSLIAIMTGDLMQAHPSHSREVHMAESYGGGPNRVVITGVEMSFGDLVVFILKVMLASIPAYIILFIIFSILFAVFGSVLAGLVGMGGMH